MSLDRKYISIIKSSHFGGDILNILCVNYLQVQLCQIFAIWICFKVQTDIDFKYEGSELEAGLAE